MKHTPGPWSVIFEEGGEFYVNAVGQDGPLQSVYGDICTSTSPAAEGREEESHANARLIAASPTMYDFIKKLADEGNRYAAEIISSI